MITRFKMHGSCLILITLFSVALSANYEGYKVYKVMPKNEAESQVLATLEVDGNLDFWSRTNKLGIPVTVMVSPEDQVEFEATMATFEIFNEVLFENVQTTIEHGMIQSRAVTQGGVTFDNYMRHTEINTYLDQLGANYPDLVSLINIGKSLEGRDMNLIKISRGDSPKPVIFIDAGIHAREWIAPAVALYIIHQLVEVPGNENLSQNVEWVILPSLNPDGYEFSWDVDRLWRKTRSPGKRCPGVDANRNFDFHWMEAGSSQDECTETFAGTEPFTEPEAVNLREYLLNKKNVSLYLTLHSYGPYLLYPWGYADVLPDNWRELDDLGHAVNDAIKAVTTLDSDYDVGSSTEVLYAASGASDDWSMGRCNISLVYTMELPGGGEYGFDLPPNKILPVVTETWEGIKVFHEYVESKTKNLIE